MLTISYQLTQNKKEKPDYNNLGFGQYFTDHMFLMDYTKGQGWHDARIVPYGPLALEPACAVFHYAQEMFEGMKAYRDKDGGIRLFRPMKNIERMNRTNERMCIPQIDPEDALDAIKAIVKTDADWIPNEYGKSLYIRPFIIATDNKLGVHPSKSYLFCIILSPVAAYYKSGLNPVKICIEREYVRAVKGGTGFAKVGGNYASSLKGQEKAEEMGCAQVLWLDGIYRKYIDEVGAMNVFFVINGEIITPTLEAGNILPGVTRASCIEILKSWGYKVTERQLAVDEVIEAAQNGTLDEAFGTGTAAVISPIGTLIDKGIEVTLNKGEIGPISQKLYDTITGIQYGLTEDPYGYSVKI